MKATEALHDLGQSLWVDNITRDMLDSGTLKRYIDEFSITGLPSNPAIFYHAISKSSHTTRLPRQGGDCEQVLAEFESAGIDLVELGASLQSEGAKAFDESSQELLKAIQSKSKPLSQTA